MRKVSLRPLPKLKKKAEKIFHKWIVERDKNVCYTCGNWGNQGGHFWHGKLDFDERNLHCQCVRCNKYLSGNLAEYGSRLISEYGKKWFEKLNSDAHQVSNKFSRDELEQITLKYKGLIQSKYGYTEF